MTQAQRKRAFFIINSLEGGGAERVFATLTEGLSNRLSMDIELVLLDRLPEIYKVPGEIGRHQLDCRHGYVASVAQLVALVRRERPDLLFSFLTRSNCAAVVAGLLTGAPVALSERVHTSSHLGQGAAVKKLLVRLLYPCADHIVAASQGVAEDLRERYGVPARKMSVIYNPIRRQSIMARSMEPLSIKPPQTMWLAIGRLTQNKNFPTLIEAFAQAGVPGDLVILGEGPERQSLLRLAGERNISDRVHLPGYVDNPYAYLRRAYAYVSASNAEGFPNALVEALVVGIPVAVTDCDSGPSEILRGALAPKITRVTEAEHGILVPTRDPAAMAEAMRKLADSALHAHYAERASRRAEDFDFSRTLDEYAARLNTLISKEPPRR